MAYTDSIAKYGEDAFIHEQVGVVCDLNEAKKKAETYVREFLQH